MDVASSLSSDAASESTWRFVSRTQSIIKGEEELREVAGTAHGDHHVCWTKAMAWLEQTETEARDHTCPACGTRTIVGRGRVLASATGIRADSRCARCAYAFVVLSPTPLMLEE